MVAEWNESNEVLAGICDNCGNSEFWYGKDDEYTIAECKECGKKQYL